MTAIRVLILGHTYEHDNCHSRTNSKCTAGLYPVNHKELHEVNWSTDKGTTYLMSSKSPLSE